MSSRKGIVCGLTGEIADFEDECPDYVLDVEHQKQLEELKERKSYNYNLENTYVVPKLLKAKWKNTITLLPFLFVAAHLLFHPWRVRWNHNSDITFSIIVILFMTYLITSTLYRKHPITVVTISVIFSFVVSTFFLLGFIRYNWQHAVIPTAMFFCYFFILTDLHMFKKEFNYNSTNK